jgi:hypothetical protein
VRLLSASIFAFIFRGPGVGYVCDTACHQLCGLRRTGACSPEN